MFTVDKSVIVNNLGELALNRHQVWQGLVMKAENALPFVAAMTHCKVLSRAARRLVRQIVFKGETMQERVTLTPEIRVRFDRLSGSAKGFVLNEIFDDAAAGLTLRFTFTFEIDGMPHGSDAERAFATNMEKDYLSAVQATVGAIRRAAHEGKLSSASASSAASWLVKYYDDIDNMRMEPFIAAHTDDVRVTFGNHPPAVGRDAVRGAIGGFWQSINGLKHNFVNVYDQGATTVLEAHIDFTRKDGRITTVPCVSILERSGALVKSLRIFIDLAPVYAPL